VRVAPEQSETRKANNKTVVHLRNAASPVQDGVELPPRCINVTAIKLDNEGEQQLRAEGPVLGDDQASATTKPVKRVEFCKTEIHFAADSGKVNIVETDGKPPPTNKFRRRRRNSNGLGTASSNHVQVRLTRLGPDPKLVTIAYPVLESPDASDRFNKPPILVLSCFHIRTRSMVAFILMHFI
jgi:hypothetical protein